MKDDKFSYEPDRDNLDKDWAEIPDLIQEAAEVAAKWEVKVKRAERNAELMEAKVGMGVRQTPIAYGYETKPAETAIKDIAKLHKKSIDAWEDYYTALEKLGKLKSHLTGLLEKRRSLENLVILHGQGYFAVPRDKTGSARDMIRHKADEAVQSSLKKKGRR